MSDDSLHPRDHAEAVALFRAEVIGALARRELARGEFAAAIRELAKVRYRPPGLCGLDRETKNPALLRGSAGGATQI